MAKIKNICLLVLSLFIGTGCFSQGHLREHVTTTALSQLGIRELTGNNDGKQVEAYLKSVGLTKGAPWCAAFVSWCYQINCIPNPKSGWSPNWFPHNRVVYQRNSNDNGMPLKADAFGIYFPEKGRVAHVGMILDWSDNIVLTIEGNTNDAGSREGDGVYKKRRLKRQVYVVSKWI